MVQQKRKPKRQRAASNKVHLTEKSVAKLPIPTHGRTTHLDDSVRGLGVMVRDTGDRSYFWYRKIAGRGRWKTLGDCASLSLDGPGGARDLAGRWNARAYGWGADNFEPEKSPFAVTKEHTLQEALDRYVAKRVRQGKHPDQAEKKMRQRAAKHLRGLLGLRMAEITDRQVSDLHSRMASKPRMANSILQLVSRLFRFAVREKMYRGVNPAENIDLHRDGEIERERFVLLEELPRLRAALDRSPSQNLRLFVELSLLTGARSSDVLGMAWADIVLVGDELRQPHWRVPDSKSGPYTALLVPRAVELLRERLAQRTSDTWVFPSRRKSGDVHIVTLRHEWDALIRDAGLFSEDPEKRLRIHDLRRSTGSWMAMAGVSLPMIAKVLGHKSVRATHVYARLAPDAARASLEKSSELMYQAMNGKIAAQPPAPKPALAPKLPPARPQSQLLGPARG